MILSMTGYGKSVAEFNGKKIIAEIKSLNSKSLDLSTRISPIYREKEMEIRALISNQLERGKVDFSLWIEQSETNNLVPINESVIEAYFQQITDLSQRLNLPVGSDLWTSLLRMPEALGRTEVQVLTEEEWDVARKVCEEAIQQLIDFRRQEGEALQQKFQKNLDRIAELLQSIEPYEKERTVRIKQRLIDALEAIPSVEYDRGRLEQEMIFYIEKLDINEEKQRLTNHLRYFRQTMDEGHGQGKKLGFIAQEMGREINTTGSKSNQAEMQNIVVMMKDELEQIKEQVLNVM